VPVLVLFLSTDVGKTKNKNKIAVYVSLTR
jgi:hypothetical protein